MFEQVDRVVYVPPGVPFRVETAGAVTVAIGSAPAEGKLPARVIAPSEMRSEIRGGGASYRQVIHSLAHPLQAERLILCEVYIPRGTWHVAPGRGGRRIATTASRDLSTSRRRTTSGSTGKRGTSSTETSTTRPGDTRGRTEQD